MSRYAWSDYVNDGDGGRQETRSVLKAAEEWREKCLKGNGSMFFEGREIWTPQNFEILRKRYNEAPDTSEEDFMEKLEGQLRPLHETNQDDVIILMAEILWLIYLPQNHGEILVATRKTRICKILSWAGIQDVTNVKSFLDESCENYIANLGRWYKQQRWPESTYAIHLLHKLKNMGKNIEPLLNDHIKLAAFCDRLAAGANLQFRHVILYLLFPDKCERIFSRGEREKILERWERYQKNMPLNEMDAHIAEIRKELEGDRKIAESQSNQYQEHMDFYQPWIRVKWDSKYERGILRPRVVKAAGQKLHIQFHPLSDKKKKTLFESEKKVRLCVLCSKKHPPKIQKKGQNYLHTLEPPQKEFLKGGGKKAYLALACGGLPHAYLLPYQELLKWLDEPERERQRIFLAENFNGYEGWHAHFENAHRQAEYWPLEDYEGPLDPLPWEIDDGGIVQNPSSVSSPSSPTHGPRPEERGYSGTYDPNKPAFTYLLRFAKTNVWKAGWAHKPVKRCHDINKHIPVEILREFHHADLGDNPQWAICKTAQWDNAEKAHDIEQKILKSARGEFPGKVRGERVQCTEAEILEIWRKKVDEHSMT